VTRWGSAKTQWNSLRIATLLSPQPASTANDIKGEQRADQEEERKTESTEGGLEIS